LTCACPLFAVGANFLGDARNFVGERTQLIDHRIDGGSDSQELALDRLAVDLKRHLLIEIALRDGVDNVGDLGGRLHQTADQRINRALNLPPSTDHTLDGGPLGQPSLPANRLLDAGYFARDSFVALDDRVEPSGELVQQFVVVRARQPDRKVPLARCVQCLDQFLEAAAVRLFARFVMAVPVGFAVVCLDSVCLGRARGPDVQGSVTAA
jgi:hypothetical protein